MAIQLAEIIDRIWITVPLDLPQLMQCHDHLWGLIKAKKAKPKQVKGGWRGTFPFGGDVSVGITVAKVYGYRFLQYDLQPTELDAPTFDKFVHLTSGFSGVSYAEALVNGKVSYLEIAVDFLFKDTSDILTHMPGVHMSVRFFPADGTAPTSYTGAPKSTSGSAGYTKDKPFALGGQMWNASRARFERRLRHLVHHPIGLGVLPNQFARLEVFSVAAAEQLPGQPKDWKAFLQLARMKGVPSALMQYPVRRKVFLKSLRQCRVPWWKPATYMAKWEQTVANQLRLPLVNAGGGQ